MSKTKELCTINEICEVFSISRKTAYNWEERRILPKPIKMGGKVFYFKKDIDDLLEKKRDESFRR